MCVLGFFLGHCRSATLTLAFSLAQVSEFSFVLASRARRLDIIAREVRGARGERWSNRSSMFPGHSLLSFPPSPLTTHPYPIPSLLTLTLLLPSLLTPSSLHSLLFSHLYPPPGLPCHLKCRSAESIAVSIAMATVPCGRGTKTIHISVIYVEPSSSNHGLSLQTAEKTRHN